MDHPDITSALAKIRYDDLLQRAEMHRRIKILQRSNPGLHSRILSTLGETLIALGSRVRLQTTADA